MAARSWILTPVAIAAVLAPGAAAAETPVLGASRLSAEQMAAWYESTGARSRIALPIVNLARLFVQEGAAQGVRADLAFAQAMLETGNLRFGGLVKPTDNNFAGLGACDSCTGGGRFATAREGVRAQIQHLWVYASPAARTDALARPQADTRFGLVSPGKAPTWEEMGGGNWATDSGYAAKVLGVYARMLAHAGLAPASGSPGGPPPGPLEVLVARDGAVRLGGVRARSRPLADAIERLGPPSERMRTSAGCLVRWAGLGAAIGYAGPGGTDACDAGSGRARAAVLSGSRWRTSRGLAVGDPEGRVRELYPAARRAGAFVELVSPSRGRTRLTARLAGGRVAALLVAVPPA